MKKQEKSGIAYVLALAGKNRLLLYASAPFAVLSGLCAIVPYMMVYRSFLKFFGEGEMTEMLRYGSIAAAAIVLKFLFQVISLSFSHIGAFNTLYAVRREISRHIARLSLGFFTSGSADGKADGSADGKADTTGEIKKVIIEDVERLEKFLAHQIPDLVSAVVVPLAVFGYMLSLSVPMALCILSPAFIGLILQAVAMAITGNQMPEYHRLLGKLNSAIMQFINGMPVMKIFNLTAKSYRDYADTIAEYNVFWKRCTQDQAYTFGVFLALVESGILFSLPLGGFLFLRGTLSLSLFLFFMIMSLVFLSCLTNLFNFAVIFTQVATGGDRIKTIMDERELRVPGEGGTIAGGGALSVKFEDVSFSYGKAVVLKNLSLEIPAGKLTAFVGPSGAGKTTAAQLILRFWELTEGRIRIGATDIAAMKTEDLMDTVSFVFQETFMLNDTIYRNIAIGGKGVSEAEVEKAARAAYIHDFIVSLPAGYQTRLGEGGVKLSGGERQRICIARAMLKNASVIIFDEATSYTDIENEYKIQGALENLLKGKTVIMIAHRLHTIVGADQICVFDRGELAEAGTHGELLEQGGLYRRMWETYGRTTDGHGEEVV
ncbi:MAG: ABC transporter ATP-binding protein/permease [Spirochaetaceae bacterium]|jgi:ATP-binding cassette subfamily B protein|nr:ABC transporter ATP-binding protein/permease [Spirochaetaceae bacterium]